MTRPGTYSIDDLTAALGKAKRQRKRGTGLVAFITAMFVSTGEIFGGSGIAMLLLGAAHSTDSQVPAFGYWTVFFLVWAIRWIPLLVTANQRGGRTRKWGEEE